MKKSVIHFYTMIVIAALFLLVFLNLFFLTRNRKMTINHEIVFNYLLSTYPSNCNYQTRTGYQFRLPACASFRLGEYYTIIGTVSPPTDKSSNYQYIIDVSSITPITYHCCSLNFFIVTLYRQIIDVTQSIKIQIEYHLARFLSQESSNLVLGLTLGSSSANFSPGFRQIIKQLGLSHMVAVSGFHLSLLYSFTSGFFDKIFHKKLSVFVTIFFLAWYAILVSTPLSLLRALFMLILSLIGRNYFYKYTNSFLILLQVFLFMSTLSVLNVFNAGLQLSFLSTLGILLQLRLFPSSDSVSALFLGENRLKKFFRHLVALINASILTSFSAQLMTLPVMINSFGSLAPLGFVSVLLFSALLSLLVSLSVPLLLLSLVLWRYSFLFFLLGPLFLFLADFSAFAVSTLTFASSYIGWLCPLDFSLSLPFILLYYGFILIFIRFCFVRQSSSLVYVT